MKRMDPSTDARKDGVVRALPEGTFPGATKQVGYDDWRELPLWPDCSD